MAIGNENKLIDPHRDFINQCLSDWRWTCRKLLGEDESFDIFPFQQVILDSFFSKPFPLFVGARGSGKSFLYAVYAILKSIFAQDKHTGAKIVIIGPSFRQSREVFRYVDQIWRTSPLLRESAPAGPKTVVDRCELTIGNSVIMAVPLGMGEKVRGLRATSVLVDEVAMIPEDILNTVVRGFTAVSQNPLERTRLYKKLKDSGLSKEEIGRLLPKNQIILAGTAYYQFNHFYKIYQRYMSIIENKIQGPCSSLGEESLYSKDAYIDYRDYSVITLPCDQLPEGFLDETQIANARISMSESEYQMEYGARFAEDSQGFFPRSMIDACLPTENSDLWHKRFIIELEGEKGAVYVMGIDPARTLDNLSIAIVKIESTDIKPVYMWSTQNKSFIEAAKLIRRLLRAFNISLVGMDKGGGGFAIRDNLQTDKLLDHPEDKLIWDTDDTDIAHLGPRILSMVNYQGAWLRNANYALKADLQHKRIVWPYSIGEDKYTGVDADRHAAKFEGSALDEATKAWEEIEACKDETANIVKTSTPKTEEEHFDLPRFKGARTVQRKDRYSALLIACDMAHSLIKTGENKEAAKIEVPMGDWVRGDDE